ncbi:MAG: glycosyltransferase family 4 protein [Prevotellaceae bacterium]|nr:glycosyltransferase family 4 protein [Candidatus Faecinaster equi]
MNILYIHQYFHTPAEPGGTRSYWISKELVKRGHNVTMITSTNTTSHPEPCTEMIDGIKVIYVKNEYSNYMSPLKKVYSFVHFLQLAINEGCKQNDIDMVYATSTPLTIGYVAMRLKAKKKFPYVFEVRDLWPEFPIQVGAIKNKLVIKFLRWIERRIYEESEHVVALSPGMQDGVIAAGTPKEKTSMIPNMSKPDEFHPHEPNMEVAKQFGVDTNKFNLIHFGTMGVANALDYIINAAKVVADKGVDDINFIFMGHGAMQPKLEKMVEEYGLKNVKFLGNHKMATVIEMVNLCDASITTFKNLPILKTNSPNKLFDSLSASKPIIVNSDGWTKDMVEKGDCGFFVNPDDPKELADKLIEIKDNKELLEKWGKNARILSETVYDKKILSAQAADAIEAAYKNLKK